MHRSEEQKKNKKKGGHTDMYLQAVRQLGDGLLQEQRHEQEVELRHVGVFGQQRLQHRQPGEVARLPVDLPQRGAPPGAAAHVEACGGTDPQGDENRGGRCERAGRLPASSRRRSQL